VEEELDVPFRTGDRRGRRGYRRQSYLTRRGGHFVNDAGLDGRIANHTFADFAASRFELRFDERNDVALRTYDWRHHRQDLSQRDEGDVNRHDVDRAGKIGRLQVSGIEMLDDEDPRIVAQRPIDLPMANVERDDVCGASFEKDVREAPGGGTDVERLATFNGDVERVEGVRQLHAAATDIRVIGREETEVGGGVDLRAGFRFDLAVNKDLSRQNQRSCALSRRREAPFHDELIQANAQFLQP
jgi:hypothetical protein